MSGIVTRDCAKQGDAGLRGLDQPRPRPYADRDPALVVGFKGGTVSQGQEFAQIADGVCGVKKALLGPAFVGEGILGRVERERDR